MNTDSNRTDQSTTVSQLRERLAQFVAQREWGRYHDPKNLAMSVAIEAAELMEHFQWLRSDELDVALRDESKRNAIRDELADVFCYLLSLANTMQIDVADAVFQKISKNETKYPVERFRGNYHKPAG